MSARRLPFHFGPGTQCLQQSYAGDGQGSPEGWQLCRQLGTLAGAAQARVRSRENSDLRRFWKGTTFSSCRKPSKNCPCFSA